MEPGTGRLRAALIGAGNVAWGLAPALQNAGIDICRIVARTPESALALANAIAPDAETATTPAGADIDVDIVVVAASDSAIAAIAASCPGSKAMWIHTSGSVEASVLAAASQRYGVVYPMQTFTRGVAVSLDDAAIFVEGSDPATTLLVRDIANRISRRVREADSACRRQLHCAAVFACNFTNHLWAIADRLASEAGSSLDDFMPLIDETLRKARAIGPEKGQTGPARRGAAEVIKAHEALLPRHFREIYTLLSDSIAKTYEQN